MSFRRILIAVNEDPVAIHAAEVGVELATALNAEIAFIYVIDPRAIAAPDSGIPAGELRTLAENEARATLSTLRERLPARRSSLDFVTDGSPASEIIKAAIQWPAELIVLGTHGRHGVPRAVLGSVAENVMRHAPCPVLVSRAEH